MRIEKCTITPALAHEWLAQNASNRGINRNMVESLARDIKNNEWLVTGDCIRLSKTKEVLDGQHRLQAVITANRSIETYVAFDCPNGIRHVMDSGRSRTLSDILKIAGESHTAVLASVARKVYLLEHGKLVSNGGTTANSICIDRITRAEILAVVDRHPELRAFAEKSRRFPFRRAPLAFCEWFYASKYPRKAAEFFDQVATGENLSAGSAALVLRNQFLTKLKVARVVTNEAVVLGLIFRAMQAHCQNEAVRTLRPTRRYELP